MTWSRRAKRELRAYMQESFERVQGLYARQHEEGMARLHAEERSEASWEAETQVLREKVLPRGKTLSI